MKLKSSHLELRFSVYFNAIPTFKSKLIYSFKSKANSTCMTFGHNLKFLLSEKNWLINELFKCLKHYAVDKVDLYHNI